MITELLISFLNEKLGIYVGMEQPEQKTGYVILDQTGSSTMNRIKTTTFAVQSYGASLLEAMQLNGRVEAAMEEFAELPQVAGIRLETDYNFTDTTTKQYRWQAVYDITHY